MKNRYIDDMSKKSIDYGNYFENRFYLQMKFDVIFSTLNETSYLQFVWSEDILEKLLSRRDDQSWK